MKKKLTAKRAPIQKRAGGYKKSPRFTLYSRPPGDNANGKLSPSARKLWGKTGVYKIFEAGKIIYIGSSTSNLYKTIIRKFQTWNDRDRGRLNYDAAKKDYKIQVVLFQGKKWNLDELLTLEYELIKKYKPRDNHSGNYSPYNMKTDFVPGDCIECEAKTPTMTAKQWENEDEIPF